MTEKAFRPTKERQPDGVTTYRKAGEKQIAKMNSTPHVKALSGPLTVMQCNFRGNANSKKIADRAGKDRDYSTEKFWEINSKLLEEYTQKNVSLFEEMAGISWQILSEIG